MAHKGKGSYPPKRGHPGKGPMHEMPGGKMMAGKKHPSGKKK